MRQDSFLGPVNIGSEEMVTINELAQMAINSSGKSIAIKNIDGEEFITKYGFKCPVGVRGRNSDNTLYKEKMGVDYDRPLSEGVNQTFKWINKQANG
jgi:nucleoside-diphosphate-sugar epimerase